MDFIVDRAKHTTMELQFACSELKQGSLYGLRERMSGFGLPNRF